MNFVFYTIFTTKSTNYISLYKALPFPKEISLVYKWPNLMISMKNIYFLLLKTPHLFSLLSCTIFISKLPPANSITQTKPPTYSFMLQDGSLLPYVAFNVSLTMQLDRYWIPGKIVVKRF